MVHHAFMDFHSSKIGTGQVNELVVIHTGISVLFTNSNFKYIKFKTITCRWKLKAEKKHFYKLLLNISDKLFSSRSYNYFNLKSLLAFVVLKLAMDEWMSKLFKRWFSILSTNLRLRLRKQVRLKREYNIKKKVFS